MEELHEKRGEYVKRVRDGVAADLLQNGLELETVSLTQLDQTGMEFFNPSNAFDAEGLTRLTEQIERRKKIRNDIEQDTMIQIRNKNLETEKQSLDIDRELEYARLAQEREIEIQRATQRAELAREQAPSASWRPSGRRSARARRSRRARIARRARARGASASPGARDPGAARSSGARPWSWPSSSAPSPSPSSRKAQSEAQAAADQARAEAVAEEERVFTARETEMAERRKRIELIAAAQEAEREALRLRVAAEPRGGGRRPRRGHQAEAEAEADADKIRALAAKLRHEVEAEGARLMNEAQNMLTPEARLSAHAPAADRQARGDHPRAGQAAWSASRASRSCMSTGSAVGRRRRQRRAGGGAGGFADNVVNSALRYRAQAPLVDQLLREIGVQGGDVGKVAQAACSTGAARPGRPLDGRRAHRSAMAGG